MGEAKEEKEKEEKEREERKKETPSTELGYLPFLSDKKR
jgi:hypothetical protein